MGAEPVDQGRACLARCRSGLDHVIRQGHAASLGLGHRSRSAGLLRHRGGTAPSTPQATVATDLEHHRWASFTVLNSTTQTHGFRSHDPRPLISSHRSPNQVRLPFVVSAGNPSAKQSSLLIEVNRSTRTPTIASVIRDAHRGMWIEDTHFPAVLSGPLSWQSARYASHPPDGPRHHVSRTHRRSPGDPYGHLIATLLPAQSRPARKASPVTEFPQAPAQSMPFVFTTLRVCVFRPARMARTIGPENRIGRSRREPGT